MDNSIILQYRMYNTPKGTPRLSITYSQPSHSHRISSSSPSRYSTRVFNHQNASKEYKKVLQKVVKISDYNTFMLAISKYMDTSIL